MKKLVVVALYVTVLDNLASVTVYTSVNHETVFKNFRIVDHFEAMKICAKYGLALENIGKYVTMLQASKSIRKWY